MSDDKRGMKGMAEFLATYKMTTDYGPEPKRGMGPKMAASLSALVGGAGFIGGHSAAHKLGVGATDATHRDGGGSGARVASGATLGVGAGVVSHRLFTAQRRKHNAWHARKDELTSSIEANLEKMRADLTSKKPS